MRLPRKLAVLNLDTAFKLAEQWVKNMSKSSENESTKLVLKARPPRLGFGAAIPRQSQVAPSNDPVERKLHAEKRKAGKNAEESVPSARDESIDEDSYEELESRTKAFAKKRPISLTSLQATKKEK